ncbi:MAG: GNAT family N-acetyltransferase [Cytophagales bacterium]|nr:GNAT family N-acetyltransferase [Armatimonadota bacterium]
MTQIRSFFLRPFDHSDADYEARVAIGNAVTPDQSTTVAEQKEQEAQRIASHQHQIWLAEAEGQTVGMGSFRHDDWEYHPTEFWLRIAVLPKFQGRGCGGTLYRHLLENLAPLQPTALKTYCREDRARGLRFAQDRGFMEEMRIWESRLDVAAFDPEPFAAEREKVSQLGIVIRSLRDLESDPDRDRKVWELEMETSADVPSTSPFTPLTYDEYRKHAFDASSFLPDGFVVAVEESTGDYVGTSHLWRRRADQDLQTGLTAVRRTHRRRGIALAMKLRVIDYAKSLGTPIIRTENAQHNRAMLAINEALGFTKLPAGITLVKRLTGKTAESQ